MELTKFQHLNKTVGLEYNVTNTSASLYKLLSNIGKRTELHIREKESIDETISFLRSAIEGIRPMQYSNGKVKVGALAPLKAMHTIYMALPFIIEKRPLPLGDDLKKMLESYTRILTEVKEYNLIKPEDEEVVTETTRFFSKLADKLEEIVQELNKPKEIYGAPIYV